MRNAYWDGSRKLLVFWTQKSACTAVANWFATGVLGITAPMKGGARAWLIRYNYRLDPESAAPIARTKARNSVAFVRHPFDRMISAYLNKFVVHYDEPLVRFEQLEKMAQLLYCEIRGVTGQQAAASYQGLTFMEMLEAVLAASRSAGGGEPDLDSHFNRQYPALFADQRIVPSDLVHIEHMDTELAAVNAKYGVSYAPPRSNVTNYAEDSHQPLWDVSSLELARSGAALARQSFASADAIAMVREAHAPDYELFGYAPAPEWAARSLSRKATPAA